MTKRQITNAERKRILKAAAKIAWRELDAMLGIKPRKLKLCPVCLEPEGWCQRWLLHQHMYGGESPWVKEYAAKCPKPIPTEEQLADQRLYIERHYGRGNGRA